MNGEAVILLVEDNPDDEFLTRRALKKARVANSLIIARDGAEALDMLLGRGEWDSSPLRPAIVLLDLQLPKVDGLSVLRQLRAQPSTQRLPVVILTSSRTDQDMMTSYNLGANSYVVKPVDPDQFDEAVRQLGLYWAVVNESPVKK